MNFEKLKNKNILIIEDDELTLEVLQSFLKRFSNNIHFTTDVNTAKKLIQTEIFDIILSDISLPGKINGIEFYKKYGKKLKNVSYFLMTGNSEDDINLNVNIPILKKPIDFSELLKHIEL